MKKIIENQYVLLILRLVVGYIFISYGVGKISNPEKFAGEIANYSLLPEVFLNLFALILPWVEVIVGVLISLGVRVKASSLVSSSLMFMFILAVIWAMAMGLDINCGCSTTNPQKVGLPKLIENLLLFLASIVLFIFPSTRFSFDN